MKNSRFKQGVASFYIVAFAALILVIIASSFVMVVISEINRASNSDLSRSAYDSAMAGVEDAKLALLNYQACLKTSPFIGEEVSLTENDEITCEEIIYYMRNPDCDMVAHILGRLRQDERGEVEISEGVGSSNNMSQAYTCVIVKTELPDYRAGLSASNSYRVIKVNLEDPSQIDDIKSVVLSWHAVNPGGTQYGNISGENVVFGAGGGESDASTPPTLAFQLVQTENYTVDEDSNYFLLRDVNSGTTVTPSVGGGEKIRTDRATLYLVPTKNSSAAASGNENHYPAYDPATGFNKITAAQFASTNNLEKNLPYEVYCNDDDQCSVTIGIPEPIGTEVGGKVKRNADTFMFVVSLPYGQPETEFALSLCTSIGVECTSLTPSELIAGDEEVSNEVNLKNMQVSIDSTGRANDLYSRVEVRMEGDSRSMYFPYAIQATDPGGGGGSAEINKTLHPGSD